MKNESEFWGKVRKVEPNKCWMWTGHTNADGYGQLSWHGKTVRAHRLSWEIAGGVIPESLLVCHRCDNPSCVNPFHLFLGTHSDNMRDSVEKGRHSRRGSAPKLSRKTVREIRGLHGQGMSYGVLGEKYDVHPNTIAKAIKGETWMKPMPQTEANRLVLENEILRKKAEAIGSTNKALLEDIGRYSKKVERLETSLQYIGALNVQHKDPEMNLTLAVNEARDALGEAHND